MAATVEILRRLNAKGVEFVVIGGVAAVSYGSPVATEDVDICAPMSRENTIRIVEAVADAQPRWRFRPDMPVVKPDDSYLGQLKNMYLRTRLGVIDVLGELPNVCDYDEVSRTSITRTIGDVTCRFISLDLLIKAKLSAGREHDLLTVKYLKRVLDGPKPSEA